jgi:septation ring formation regulator EzrA
MGVEAARQAYLYGVGYGGVPLRDRVELQRLASVRDSAFSVHLRKWESESEELALKKQDSAFGISVKPETAEKHGEDVFFLRQKLDEIKDEVDNLDQNQADIWDFIQEIRDTSLASSEQIDSLVNLVDRYLKKSLNRQNLLGLFLSLQKRWQDSSGMTGAIEASVAGMKEVEKVKRLQDLRDNHNPEAVAVKSAPKHVGDVSIFRR